MKQLPSTRFLRYILVSLTVIFVLVFIILLTSISIGPDFSYKLSGGYKLSSYSAHTIMVTPEGGWNGETPIIPEKVIEIAWNKQFILAKRQGLKRRSPDNADDTYLVPDEFTFDYWILDVSAPHVYGPLTFEAFLKNRTELSIPNGLVLKDVYEFH